MENNTNAPGRTLDPRAHSIAFLYRMMPLPKSVVELWLSTPEFVDGILSRMQIEKIDAGIVLSVMKDVYEKMQPYRQQHSRDFNFSIARRSIKVMEKMILSTVGV